MNNIVVLFDETWLKALIGGTFTDSYGRKWKIGWYAENTKQLFFVPEGEPAWKMLGDFYISMGEQSLKN